MQARIPQYIDNPPQILFWEADEIAPIFLIMSVGVVTQTLTYTLVLAWGFQKAFIYFKSKRLRGYLMHWLYRVGLTPLNKKFQNGAINYFHV